MRMIDLDLLERGTKFIELKSSYIIFICLENLFPEIGRHKYSFRNTCAEQPDLELGDGSYKIILSAQGTQNDVPQGLQAFLSYIAGNMPESDLTKRLDHLVKKARKHIEWRKEYMTLLERDEIMREEGRKEGRKEGREEERENTRKEKARADEAERQVALLKKQIAEFEQASVIGRDHEN